MAVETNESCDFLLSRCVSFVRCFRATKLISAKTFTSRCDKAPLSCKEARHKQCTRTPCTGGRIGQKWSVNVRRWNL